MPSPGIKIADGRNQVPADRALSDGRIVRPDVETMGAKDGVPSGPGRRSGYDGVAGDTAGLEVAIISRAAVLRRTRRSSASVADVAESV